MRITILVFLLFGSLPQVLAQSAILEGTVVEESARQPIGFCTVSLYRAGDSSLVAGTVSDAGGKFVLKNLGEGAYYLVAQFLGYVSKNISHVSLDKSQYLNLGVISLAGSRKLLREVVVKGEKATIIHKIDRQVYQAGQFQSATGGTAVDVIRNLPSVSVDAQGGISVRGSSGFVVLLNGKPVQADAAQWLSQLPANAIENVEVITSPSAKYDADGKGGIINITTKTGAHDGVSLVVNAVGGLPSVNDFDNKEKPRRYGADFTLNYKQGKWDVSVGSSYNRNDNAGRREGDANTTIGNRFTSFPSTGERSFDKYNYSSWVAVGYNPDKTNAFRAGFYNGIRTEYRLADIDYTNTTTDLTSGQVISRITYYNANLVKKRGVFYLGNLDYSHTFANQSVLSVSGLAERDDLSGFVKNLNLKQLESIDTLQYTLNTNERPLTGYRIKADYQINWGSGKLESGYQYRILQDQGIFVYLQKNKHGEPLTFYPEFSGNAFVHHIIHSLYGQYSGAYRKKLTYVGGLRYEYATRNLRLGQTARPFNLKLSNLFPSASLLYRVNDRWQAKAGYSRRVQRSTSPELNPLPEREHSETLEQGDPNLLPEFISLAELGGIRNFKSGSLFATLYYQGITNAVNRVNSVYADSILNRIYTNAGNARRVGLEVGLDLKPTDWWKIYLGGNAYDYRIKGSLFNNAVAVNNASLVYSVNANTELKLSKTLNLQGSLNYLSGRATAQGEDSRFFSLNASLKKTWLDGRLSAMIQWQNMDVGLLRSNEQRITTRGKDFYTTTNYVYEKDVLLINLSYSLNQRSKKAKFTESEFGEKEF